MNCKDFKEIADSYLSNELLVETNHDVLRHLESCPDCRGELGSRRELRERLRSAVKNSEFSQIDPRFVVRTKSELRRQAFAKSGAWSFFELKTLLAGAAVILIAVMAGVIVQNRQPEIVKTGDVPINAVLDQRPDFQHASYIDARRDAVDDHKNCALTHNLEENPISLAKASLIYGKANKNIDAAVIAPLREVFGDTARIVMAHFCMVNGRYFTHVVLKVENRTVSVLLTKRQGNSGLIDSDVISCQSDDDLRIACFESGTYSVFVISDMNEAENLVVARTISPSVKKHIEQAES